MAVPAAPSAPAPAAPPPAVSSPAGGATNPSAPVGAATPSGVPPPAAGGKETAPSAPQRPTGLSAEEKLEHLLSRDKADPGLLPGESAARAAESEEPPKEDVAQRDVKPPKAEKTEAAPEPDAEADADLDKPEPDDAQRERVSYREVKDALKQVADPRMRKVLKQSFELANAVTRPVAEQRELNTLFPTTDLAREAAQRSEALRDLEGAFTSGTREGIQHVVRRMAEVNPEGVRLLAREMAPHLAKVDRDAFLSVGTQALQNVANYFRNDLAKVEGVTDETVLRDYQTVADFIEDKILKGARNGAPAQDRTEHPDTRRLKELQSRSTQLWEQTRGNFLANATTAARELVEKEADALIARADPDGLYPKEATARLRGEILSGVFNQLGANGNHQAQVDGVSRNGDFGNDHLRRLAELQFRAARSVLDAVAPARIDEFARMFDAVQTKRQEREERTAARRDVGAAGAPARLAPAAPQGRPRGLSTEDKLDHLLSRGRA